MDGIEESSGKGGVKFFLLALPVCLVVSIVGAIWFHWYKETEEVADPGLAMGGEGIEREEVEDSLKKLTEYIGKRDWETVEGRKNLRKVLAFVEGTLSPQNYGFVVHTGAEVSFEGELWPMVWVDVEGTESAKEIILLCATYDRDDFSVVALLTAARELRGEALNRTVRILFYPEELFRDHFPRDRFVKDGEKLAVVMRLLGFGGDGNAGLEIVGAEVKGVEEQLSHSSVDRIIQSRGGSVEEAAFGKSGAAVYLEVGPDYAMKWSMSHRGDAPMVAARTQMLVELVRQISGGME